MAAARKKKDDTPLKDVVHIKYVAKAGMWCKTSASKGKQVQEWTLTKPS